MKKINLCNLIRYEMRYDKIRSDIVASESWRAQRWLLMTRAMRKPLEKKTLWVGMRKYAKEAFRMLCFKRRMHKILELEHPKINKQPRKN